MANIVLVGAQWGDEGKGKIIDFLTEKSDYVVRFQGGSNAGHTVRVGAERFVLHQIPSGIIRNHIICVIANGVVLDPEELIHEIGNLKKRKIRVDGRLFVSDQAHVIMPYHKLFDRLAEQENEKRKIGTTQRGIGPCYADKAARLGIRVGDFLDIPVFKQRLKQVLDAKNKVLKFIYRHPTLSYTDILKRCLAYRKRLLGYTRNTPQLLHDAVHKRKRILLEGAQGTFLDVDHGTYPYVTSSNSSVGGAITGTGMGLRDVHKVIGVVKAYTTRVGEGPFPTEMEPAMLRKVRDWGEEFGATTGRPRRCGWFDAVLTRQAARVNGLDSIAVTKLDVLDNLKEIKICTTYKYHGRTLRDLPSHVEVLKQCRPVFRTVKGWHSSTSQITKFRDLPKLAQQYLRVLEKLVETPIEIVSVGSSRSQTIVL
ncbi:MAG: adenylosuccinate synthase [Candidatus Omnitrophica bacterium]|nr:adenylosuccinate synthase [Candidatus Omnitrophota bacterium]